MPAPKAGAKRGEPAAQRERATRASAADDSRSLVHSLAKGLRVLEIFTAEAPELTLSEVSRAAGIDPGTAFRMLNTLVTLGYVARVADTKRFRLTLKVVDLGLHAIGRSDLRDLARPILRSLVGEVSEAASIGVLDGADVLYIERVRAGLTRLGVDIRIGTTIAAATGVIGHAILAFLPPSDLDRVLAMQPRRGDLAIVPVPEVELRQTLAAVRADGYALQESAFRNGLIILAAPVLDSDGFPLAAVSVAAPAMRISLDDFRQLALEPLRHAAADIARAVQASGTISTAV